MDKLKRVREGASGDRKKLVNLCNHFIIVRSLLFLCCLFFPQETLTVGDGQHHSLKEATGSPHALLWSSPKTGQVDVQPNRGGEPPAQICRLCSLTLFSICLLLCFVFSLTARQLRKASQVSHRLQIMSNYYGTCNPEAFGMACTTYSKMNVWRIPRGDLNPALPLIW